MTSRDDRTRAPARQRAGALLCALFVASGAIELHDLSHHNRDLALGQLLEQAASHPGIPHHFDRSEQRREAPCAACVRQAQSHGVQPSPTGRIEPAGDRPLELPASSTATLLRLSLSASPRGPPAG